MGSNNGPTNEGLKELILEQLDEIGIASGTVDIKVLKNSRVMVGGKVNSDRQRKLVIQTIREVAGVDDVIDELVVHEDEYEDYGEEKPHEEYELYDEDDEYVGSEDVFRAVEDGVPYIPPTDPPFQESSEAEERRKKRKRKPGKKE